MPNSSKTACPFCGASNFKKFHKFSHLLKIEQFQRYQKSEVPLSEDGGAEPFMLCGQCHALFRRDMIDYDAVFANYQQRLTDLPVGEVQAAIESEYARLHDDPSCKYLRELAFIDRFVSPETNGCPTRALDIGSREGVIPRALKAKGFQTALIEPTTAYCNVLAEQHGIEVVCALFPSDELADESFDFISALEVLHRVDDVAGFVAAAHAKLKPGGKFMLGLNNVYKLGLNYLTQQHRALFTPASATSLLSRAGFTVLTAEPVEDHPCGGLRVMAQKAPAATASSTSELDSAFRLKTYLLRADFGLVGPRAWARNEMLDAVALRILTKIRD